MTGTAGSLSYRLMAPCVVIRSAGAFRATHLVSHGNVHANYPI
jgi:hypothetical protein